MASEAVTRKHLTKVTNLNPAPRKGAKFFKPSYSILVPRFPQFFCSKGFVAIHVKELSKYFLALCGR